jgi:hypothetical protein
MSDILIQTLIAVGAFYLGRLSRRRYITFLEGKQWNGKS